RSPGSIPFVTQSADSPIARDFYRFPNERLNLRSLVESFGMKLREVAGVNRVAVFLEEAAEGNGTSSGPHHQRLRLMFSVGIPADIRDCLELSRNGGIGNWIMRHGRMLRADQMGGMLTPGEMPRAHHEFEILGCQVAVPITDREMTIGAALLGGHLTRASFS